MKSDNYKSLCLEQALRSPLRYRHGSVVVKGGKVIGQGFNDYRHGYDGGALKTGQLPATASPRPGSAATAPPPPKRKLKPRSPTSAAFEAVAGMGGTHLANIPLTMHGEMMAIRSALASSSTLAASTVSFTKPCFKLPGDTKRKRQLRRHAVAAYVDGDKSGALKPLHIDATRRQNGTKVKVGLHPNQNPRLKNHGPNNGANKRNKHKQQHNGARRSHENDLGGDGTKIDKNRGISSRKTTRHPSDSMEPHVLIPQGRTGAARKSIQDRKKHPKLIGADIYVTRLLNCMPSKQKCATEEPPVVDNETGQARRDGEPSDRTCPSPTLPSLSTSAGSLHDEITCRAKPCTPASSSATSMVLSMQATESRPCYLCVAYMDSVGIKRVFWTNGEGAWESAKVRDLVDSLEDFGDGDAEGNVGFVVTKHEVLRLRQVFGAVDS